MSDATKHLPSDTVGKGESAKAGLVATGGVLGAIAASTCCIVPLVLFSLGVSGAWIGRLTALAAYQPYFVTLTLGLLGYGYWRVYRPRKADCAEDAACAQRLPNRLVKAGLWSATALVALSLAWPHVVPLILA